MSCAGPTIDSHAALSWHFPLNQPKREYQFQIIQEALFKNTLVVLPAGLGKTFIAAVVIYNYYRWFPSGKIVFIAPTRPIVTRKMMDTMSTVEIDPHFLAELTGAQSPTQRERLWIERRVFFLTAQVLENDLISGICPVKSLVLLVFDEAHRALGNHAYCSVIRAVVPRVDLSLFRVLALTKTPTSNLNTAQQLIDNLLISCILTRTEESPDVKPYFGSRCIETRVVSESPEILFVRSQFEETILKPYLVELNQTAALFESNPAQLGSYQLIQAREAMRKRSALSAAHSHISTAERLFAVLISLYNAYELLILHGIVVFKAHLCKIPEESDTLQCQVQHELQSNPFFGQLMSFIDSQTSHPLFVSHPKIDIVDETLLKHFSQAEESRQQTRAVVFSQYPEVVFEILSKLNRHSPTIKAISFVEQSSRVGNKLHAAQKQQVEILEKFRNGCFNVLVATFIGEEKCLDVQNVDLMIFLDLQSSPTRMLQQVGRTRRDRDEKILLLLSAGKEEQKYKQNLRQQKSVQKVILNSAGTLNFFHHQASMLKLPVKVVERQFNTTSNSAYVDSQSHRAISLKPSPPKTAINSCSIQIPKQIVAPNLTKFVAWQMNLGATFKVPHSKSTILLAKLLNEIEKLDRKPEIFCENFLDSSKKPFYPPISTDSDDLNCLMANAMCEMSTLKEPQYKPRPLAVYASAFDCLFGDSPHKKIEPDGLLLEQDLPDSFFDDSSLEILPEISPNNMPVSRVKQLASPSHLKSTQEDSKPSIVDVSSAVNSSQGVFLPPRRVKTLLASSSLDTECVKRRKKTALSYENQKVCHFVDFEAGCSEDDLTADDDPDAITASLAAFIDDRSDLTADQKESSDDSGTTAPSSEGMMAFYRKTAYQSQMDPHFTTAPRQFAVKTKLKYGATDPNSSDIIEELEGKGVGVSVQDIDWSSDLEF